jgi:hypothetical protein
MTEVTDPYLKVVNAIIGALQTLTDFFPKDYQVTLNRSDISRGGDYFFLLSPGAFSDSRLDNRTRIVTWSTPCELAVRFAEYNSRTEKFLLCRGAVRAKLLTPHILKDIRIDPPVLMSGGDLRQDVPGLNPNWITQPITVTVNQMVSNT